MVFILQQFTGQGFVSQCRFDDLIRSSQRSHMPADSPRFYKTVGLGANAFKYNIASSVVAWAGVLIGMCLFDTVGRRNMLIAGGVLQSVFLFAVAGIGKNKHFTTSQADGFVASVMLFNFFFSGTWAPIAYVVSKISTSSFSSRLLIVRTRLALKSVLVHFERRPWRFRAPSSKSIACPSLPDMLTRI